MYIGTLDVLKEVSANSQPKVDVIFSGCRKKIQNFPNLSCDLKLSRNSYLILINSDLISFVYQHFLIFKIAINLKNYYLSRLVIILSQICH